jgi:hypothetical protein
MYRSKYGVSNWVLSVAIVAGCATSLLASEARPRPMDTSSPTEESLLQDAITLLSAADADYKGHRVKARHEVVEACRANGYKVKRGGHGREAQGTSDAIMREALGCVQQAEQMAQADHQNNVIAHLDAATSEIEIALRTK